MINYNGKIFKSVTNTSNGQVSSETIFHYHQAGDIVWATYEGGQIRLGNLIAKVIKMAVWICAITTFAQVAN